VHFALFFAHGQIFNPGVAVYGLLLSLIFFFEFQYFLPRGINALKLR